MDYITMGPGDVRVGAFSSTPHCPQYRIVLSRDLLESIKMAGEIPLSFTNFMTTPELSNSLYISPDIYHTQITEYLLNEAHLRWALFSLCIEHCPDCYSVRPFYRNESLWDHLSRALPTEMIFDLLRSIRSERLIHDDYMLDTLEIIIKWLQVSVSEWWSRQPSPSQTKNRFVSRDLIPSGRATCTIASRLNFFDTRMLYLSIDFEVWDLRLSVSQANVINTSKHFYMIVNAFQPLLVDFFVTASI